MEKNFYEKVYEVVKEIPKGRVTTYGAIAAKCGNPRTSRSVGAALHRNPDPGHIPCHRVVFADGSLTSGFAFGGKDAQKSLLEKEGICFVEEYVVDIEKHFWKP